MNYMGRAWKELQQLAADRTEQEKLDRSWLKAYALMENEKQEEEEENTCAVKMLPSAQTQNHNVPFC